jgi:hypothetical protein
MSDRPLAIVFGGSRGIGAACVQALVRDGFDVAATYVASAPEATPHVRAYAADVRDAAAVAKVFADAARDFGRAPSAVVANAGINVPPGPLAQFSDESFRQLVEVNIVGAFHVLREAARQVADGGAIVALTTSMVRHAVPGGGPYTASKAAVEGLLRSLAKEAGGAPGARQRRRAGPGRHRPVPRRQDRRGQGPLGRHEPVQPHRHTRRGGRGRELPALRQGLVGARPGRAAQRRHGLATRRPPRPWPTSASTSSSSAPAPAA